jgi:cardiolipin synthase
MKARAHDASALRPAGLGATATAPVRLLAGRTLSRVAGAELVPGNALELLVDARANFDAWLGAIRAAHSSILMENYIFADDDLSREFREALAERAANGVSVCVIRDWLGCFGQSSDRFWKPVRDAGGEVRTYNPFRPTAPLGWLSRDHRKLLVVDDEVGFVAGVCVSATWLGDEPRGIPPWRDTGVAIRGPAIGDLALAFAENWSELGAALPRALPVLHGVPPVAGDVALRVIATLPSTTGVYRLDHMIAALAQKSLFIADAYFLANPAYVQALAAAARDGVDVRLLVPGTSDVPLVGALSRVGYRALLEAGVRIFEWNGSMMHAKTAVADGRWARVGSTNLNMASFYGNCEIDVAVEDERFAGRMQEQYEADLAGATEIVRSMRRRRRAPGERRGRRGSAGRAAAGAARLANTMGAAITNGRVLASSERQILLGSALLFFVLSAVAVHFPRALAWPLAALFVWLGVGLVARSLARRR